MPAVPEPIPDWSAPAPESPGLARGEVHLWRVPLGAAATPGLVDRHRDLLSADERERAAQFRFPAGTGQFVLCRAALRILLGRYLGASPDRIAFRYGENGKPSLADEPRSLEFSVSHSGDFALIGFAFKTPLGVDLECVRQMPDADTLADRYFSPVERDEYRALNPTQRLAGFFNCWTRKEAFVKAVGQGLSRPLDSFDVTLGPDLPAGFLRIDPDPGEADHWSLLSFHPAHGYVAAAAIASPHPAPSYFELCLS